MDVTRRDLSAERSERGLVQVFTGDGRGKTSAALGSILRAVGHGLKVYVVFFMKGDYPYGERRALGLLPNVTVESFGQEDFVDRFNIKPEQTKAAAEALDAARKAMLSGGYDLVVLDEVNVAVAFKLVPLEVVLGLIAEKPPRVDLILTGRLADPRLIQAADLVTEMVKIKHPYDKGMPARKGVEYWVDLLLGTTNPGKLKELRALLSEAPFRLISPPDCGLQLEVAENGVTYEENARIKAVAYAQASGLLTLADDSGLEVDALQGAPGVHSSRYAGPVAQDEDKVKLLLSRLNNVPWEKRTARFVCVMAIARPGGQVRFAFGECHGIIALSPEGQRGFGYDPIFYFPEFAQTMAELSEKVKNGVSHRAAAAREAVTILNEIAERRNLD